MRRFMRYLLLDRRPCSSRCGWIRDGEGLPVCTLPCELLLIRSRAFKLYLFLVSIVAIAGCKTDVPLSTVVALPELVTHNMIATQLSLAGPATTIAQTPATQAQPH